MAKNKQGTRRMGQIALSMASMAMLTAARVKDGASKFWDLSAAPASAARPAAVAARMGGQGSTRRSSGDHRRRKATRRARRG